jgi:hypothetical protein
MRRSALKARRRYHGDGDRPRLDALDFTTFGMVVGEWHWIGGTAAGNKFATAPRGWARVSVDRRACADL